LSVKRREKEKIKDKSENKEKGESKECYDVMVLGCYDDRREVNLTT
jgi:hypothetical protein